MDSIGTVSEHTGFKVGVSGIAGQSWFYGCEIKALHVVSVFERATTSQIGRALGLTKWRKAEVYLARMKRAGFVVTSVPIKGGPAWYTMTDKGGEYLQSINNPWKDWKPVKDKRPKVPRSTDSDTLGIID